MPRKQLIETDIRIVTLTWYSLDLDVLAVWKFDADKFDSRGGVDYYLQEAKFRPTPPEWAAYVEIAYGDPLLQIADTRHEPSGIDR